MATFSCLHLTDLHLGMRDQDHLWPNVREAFYADLGRLHEYTGPWDAVLFTGDFVQRGGEEEFRKLDVWLADLWDYFRELNSNPVLLAVPGNHDLARPKPDLPAVKALANWGRDPSVSRSFWNEPKSEYRRVVASAFQPYLEWWKRCPYRGSLEIREGLVPGDFTATWERDTFRVGIAGLNTTFLQLTEGNYRNHLACDVRQLHEPCGGDIVGWAARHDVCLLLTHQPPSWLNRKSQGQLFIEINPAQAVAARFVVHLFGHLHRAMARGQARGGRPLRRFWQGCSLFGLDKYGATGRERRRHGYAAAIIEVAEGRNVLRYFPRYAPPDPDGWRLIPDHTQFALEKDGGTLEQIVTRRDLPEDVDQAQLEALPEWPNLYVSRPLLEKQILDLFSPSDKRKISTRLVTLHGPGGVGKTRLGVACAKKLRAYFDGGVAFVRLEDRVRSKLAVAQAISQAIGLGAQLRTLEAEGQRSFAAQLLAAFAGSKWLLVLDNYEAVACDEVAGFLATLVNETETVHLLLTGQEQVKLTNLEQVVPLVRGLEPEEAEELFLARVRLKLGPAWFPTARHKRDIRRICELTESVPLSLELAAAWSDKRSLEEIAEGLEGTPLVTVPPGEQPTIERHASLERCLAWSFSLLEPATQEGFARLGVFPDTFSKDSVTEVCEVEDAEALLDRLLGAALLLRSSYGKSRYSMLGYIREYANRRLLESPFNVQIRVRFVEVFIRHLNTQDPSCDLDFEWANALEAARLGEELKKWESVLKVSRSLTPFLLRRAFLPESEALSLRALSAADALFQPRTRGAILDQLGDIYRRSGRWKEAEGAYFESVEIKRARGSAVAEGLVYDKIGALRELENDWHGAEEAFRTALRLKLDDPEKSARRRALPFTLSKLGDLYAKWGHLAKAERAYRRSIFICQQVGNKKHQAQALRRLGGLYRRRGAWQESESSFGDSLELSRSNTDRAAEAEALTGLGELYSDLGRWPEAEQEFQAALIIWADLENPRGEARTTADLGSAYRDQERWLKAEEMYRRAMSLNRRTGDPLGKAFVLDKIGRLFQKQKAWDQAKEKLHEALEILESLSDNVNIAKVLENLSAVYAESGSSAEARRMLRRALDHWERTEDQVNAQRLRESIEQWNSPATPRRISST